MRIHNVNKQSILGYLALISSNKNLTFGYARDKSQYYLRFQNLPKKNKKKK